VVTRDHFWSRYKDGGHTIQSVKMLHANFMALCFIEPELLPIKVLHDGNRDFSHIFCSCDVDNELYLYVPKIYRICKYELPTLKLSKKVIV